MYYGVSALEMFCNVAAAAAEVTMAMPSALSKQLPAPNAATLSRLNKEREKENEKNELLNL